MIWNRSIPRAAVIPVLAYLNVDQAAEWLCEAFAFTVRIRVGTHRVQLNVGEEALIIRELAPHEIGSPLGLGHSITIRVDNADAHCSRAKEHGARIIQEASNHPYGERQYVAEDFAGHSWTFSQTIADVQPEDWGGTSEEL